MLFISIATAGFLGTAFFVFCVAKAKSLGASPQLLELEDLEQMRAVGSAGYGRKADIDVGLRDPRATQV